MIKNLRQFLFIFLFCISVFLLNVGTMAEGEPIIGDIILIPEKPAMQSEVTFSVDISGDSITSVRLIVSECAGEPNPVCHQPPQNVSMSNVNDDTYEAKVTLQWDDVDKITYHIEVISDGKWIEYEEYTTDLSTGSGNTNDSNDSNGSPGFEIMVFLMAIVGVVLLFKKFKLK